LTFSGLASISEIVNLSIVRNFDHSRNFAKASAGVDKSHLQFDQFEHPKDFSVSPAIFESLPQNKGQHVINKMPQVLTVGSESLAAGFATRNNYTRTAECNRRLPHDDRAPNMPLKLGFGFLQNFCLIHDPQDRALSTRSSTLASMARRSPTTSTDEHLDQIASVLDDMFRVPGTQIRFGLDFLIGWIPGVGDSAAGIASQIIVVAAWRRGAALVTLARMITNVVLEALLGSIPVFGDAFHVVWKANRRNYRLLMREENRALGESHTQRDVLFFCAAARGRRLSGCCACRPDCLAHPNAAAISLLTKLGLRFCEDFCFVHVEDSLSQLPTSPHRAYTYEIRPSEVWKTVRPTERGRMKNLLKVLWREQKGQDLTEYALLLALLALGAITSIGTIAKTINNVFANAASNIGTAAGP
jgi:Flp pilus assembly pilin Flp